MSYQENLKLYFNRDGIIHRNVLAFALGHNPKSESVLIETQVDDEPYKLVLIGGSAMTDINRSKGYSSDSGAYAIRQVLGQIASRDTGDGQDIIYSHLVGSNTNLAWLDANNEEVISFDNIGDPESEVHALKQHLESLASSHSPSM